LISGAVLRSKSFFDIRPASISWRASSTAHCTSLGLSASHPVSRRFSSSVRESVTTPGGSPEPDPVVGEVVKAFCALKAGFEPSEALRRELLGHARKRLGPAVAPKEIEFRDQLPKTLVGKVLRRVLRDEERTKLGIKEKI